MRLPRVAPAFGSDQHVNKIPVHRHGPVDLAELERLALAASPGPWMSWIEGRDHFGGDAFIGTEAEDLYPRVVVDGKERNPNWEADQDFIAAAKPPPDGGQPRSQ
jgi:hypothetical protein